MKQMDAAKCSTQEMVKYGLGSCTESLAVNTFFGFSMLYYTKALGLSPEYAGWATFIATLWDAVTDPVMGHISDNTKSRFGKRYPYMVAGGIAMLTAFFFIWYVPGFFKTDLVIGSRTIGAMTMLFGYLVAMNLVFRTAYTVFIVPYTALGFEMSDDYADRSKIQGIRMGLNMAANLCGPAMAWFIFFPKNDPDQIKDTQIAANYIEMGTVFAIAAGIFLFLMLFFTAKYIQDSRPSKGTEITGAAGQGRIGAFVKGIGAFFVNVIQIIIDLNSLWVFIFMFFVLLGIVLVSTLQMYVFDDFMKLTGIQKTVTHGGTMVGMGLGSLSLGFFVRRFDKKGAIYFAVAWSVFCELVLAGLFLTGFLKPGQVIGSVPIAVIVFAFFHGAYWFGNGILMPGSLSMMADVSEVHKIQTGVKKDASYAAMYSLAMKISMGVSGLLAGYCLAWTGFQSGAEAVQTAESLWKVCALTFVAGPLASLAALVFIMPYKVSKSYLEKLRAEVEVTTDDQAAGDNREE